MKKFDDKMIRETLELEFPNIPREHIKKAVEVARSCYDLSFGVTNAESISEVKAKAIVGQIKSLLNICLVKESASI